MINRNPVTLHLHDTAYRYPSLYTISIFLNKSCKVKFLIFKKYCKVISSIQILKCNIANFILICQHFSFPLAIILHILVWHRFKNRGDLKIGKGLKMQIRSSVRKIINYIPHIFEIPNIDLCFRVYRKMLHFKILKFSLQFT